MTFHASPFRTLVAGILVCGCLTAGCAPQEGGREATERSAIGQNPSLRFSVSPDGATITLSREQAERFETKPVSPRKSTIYLKVVARTVAAVVLSADLQQPLVIFEAQDIAQLYSDYTRNRAAFERSFKQLARLKELLANNAVSGKDVLDAETDNRQAEASLREAESKLRQAGFNPRQLAAMRPGTVFIVADVPEARINAVDMGERVKIEFNSFPGEIISGNVTSIGDAIDPQTRTIKVGMELANEKKRIKPGMFANVSIEDRVVDAISVPRSAVVSADARAFVFVKTEETQFQRRPVILGGDSEDEKEFEVVSGLRPGERVVATHAILLKGMSFGY